MDATAAIYRFARFAEEKGLIETVDFNYTVNRLLDALKMDAPGECPDEEPRPVPETATAILDELCDCAVEKGIIEDTQTCRDLFGDRLCGLITPSPAEVRTRFRSLYKHSPKEATDWFYQMCRAVNYIKVDRVAKNVRFFQDTPAGELEITINLSKPEKDPKDIAALRNRVSVSYPKCMLCVENPGYAGRLDFPARQNHRIVPILLDGDAWYMQYSPYLYYDEHTIVLNCRHTPMCISRQTFLRLFDFVDKFPHYMLGSNADLPIVGGSILTHDHFQGGAYTFPMDRAGDEFMLDSGAEGVTASVVNWPMTCIRLKSRDRGALTDLAEKMLTAWRAWSDPACGILAETDQPHNTITPIARKTDGEYKLDLVLRNNRTTDEHPLGLFHPHADLHHVKKENIGLIEVMGLFILPGRLVNELNGVSAYLTGKETVLPDADSPIFKHTVWINELTARFGTANTEAGAQKILRGALGEKCARVLQDAGVYKQTPEGREGLMRFLRSIGMERA